MDENITETENGKPSDAEQAAAGVDESKNRKHGDTKIGLTLRILVSAYILYLAYGLIQGFGESTGNDRIIFAIAIIVFVAVGGAILLLSAKKLIKKEYADADGPTKEDGEEQ